MGARWNTDLPCAVLAPSVLGRQLWHAWDFDAGGRNAGVSHEGVRKSNAPAAILRPVMINLERVVTLSISAGSGTDAGDVEDAVVDLLDEVRERAIGFEIVPQPASDGLRSKDASQLLSATGVMLALASSGGLVALISAVKDWLLHNRSKEVSIEIGGDKITLKGARDDQVAAVIEAFLARHRE